MIRASKGIALPSLAVAVVLVAGCRPSEPLARAGVALTPPASWRPVAVTTRRVPGVPLAAWAGPDGSSLVLYRTLPDPDCSAAMIAEALANRLQNLPELRLVVNQIEKVGEMTVARIEVVAPGTGDALAPSGTGKPIAPAGKTLMPTRQVTLGFQGPDATFFLTWVSPESSYSQIAPDIKATIESLRFTSSGKPSFYGYD